MRYFTAYVEATNSYCVIGRFSGQTNGLLVAVELPKEMAETLAHNLNLNIRVERTKLLPKQTKSPQFNLNEIYELYPKKEGKSAGFTNLIRDLKTEADFESCKRAAANYRDLCLHRYATDPKFTDTYIKLFSTWTNCWRDYLERSPLIPTKPIVSQLSLEELAKRVKF